MENAFPILAIIVVFAISAAIVYWRRMQWKEAASKLGLNLSRGFFSVGELHGTYQGAPVRIYPVTRGGQNNRETYTVYAVTPPVAMPPGLKLTNEHFFSSIGKFFGAQDVEVGLPLLDQTFVIKASDPQAARDFLSRPGVEGVLLELYNTYTNMRVDDGAIVVENHGIDGAFEMEMILDGLVSTVGQMRPDEPASPPQPQPSAITPQPTAPAPAQDRKFGPPSTAAPDTEPQPMPTDANDEWW